MRPFLAKNIYPKGHTTKPFPILAAGLLLAAGSIPMGHDTNRAAFNPHYYDDWPCEDLKNELAYVLGRLKRRGHDIQTREGKDLAMTATGFAIFPPALFAVQVIETAGDHDFEQLVQHAQAISSIARNKDCPGIPTIQSKED